MEQSPATIEAQGPKNAAVTADFCRTCKYWARREHTIGLGCCTNTYVSIRILTRSEDNRLFTAQDFGCVLHKTGDKFPSIYPRGEEERILDDFLKAFDQQSNERPH